MPVSPARRLIASLHADDSFISFRQLTAPGCIVRHFAHERWLRIFPFCHTAGALDEYASQACSLSAFYEIRSVAENRAFAFVALIVDSDRKPGTVSVHGGSWEQSLAAGKLVLHAFRSVAMYLSGNGLIVHTATESNNRSAYRLIHAAGFVPYRRTATRILFRFAAKKLNNYYRYYKKREAATHVCSLPFNVV